MYGATFQFLEEELPSKTYLNNLVFITKSSLSAYETMKRTINNYYSNYNGLILLIRWTYFWIQLVHYAMETTVNPSGTFSGFLFMNPLMYDANILHYCDIYLTCLKKNESKTPVWIL